MMLNSSWQALSVTQSSRAHLSVPRISLRQAASSNMLLEHTIPLRWVASKLEKHQHQGHDARKQTSFLALVLMAHIGILIFIMQPTASLPLKQESAPMMVSIVDFKHEKQTPEQPSVPEVVPVIKPNKPVKTRPLPVVERIVEPITDQTTFQATTQESAVDKTTPTNSTPVKVEVASSAVSKPAVEEKEEPPKFGVAYLNNPEPEYPRLSRRMGEQGKVLLKVLVNASGLPATVDIAKSSGYERLDQAALQAVKSWKFEPARKGGVALSAYAMVPVSFVLD